MNNENWFSALLQKHMRAKEMNPTEFAKWLGAPRETVVGWLEGYSRPDVYRLEKVLARLGGDIRRALPDYRPEPVESTGPPEEPVLGIVQGGSLTYADDGPIKHVTAWPDLWRQSPLWGQTDPVQTAHGWRDVVLLEIAGDSMEPDYKHGELVACRRPKDPLMLQDGTPCIFETDEGLTFKLLRWTADMSAVVGEPINRAHPFIVFAGPQLKRLRIPFVVLGTLDPGTSSRTAPKDLSKIKGIRKGIR